MEARAKARSQLLLKTTFRFFACAYLLYEGIDRMIMRHFTDPDNYPVASLLFGILFVGMACVYGIYAFRVYRRGVAAESREEDKEKNDGNKNDAAGNDGAEGDQLP